MAELVTQSELRGFAELQHHLDAPSVGRAVRQVVDGLITSVNRISGSLILNGSTLVIDHGTLNGLLDDDHTQYLLLAGRTGGQAIVGNISISGTLDVADQVTFTDPPTAATLAGASVRINPASGTGYEFWVGINDVAVLTLDKDGNMVIGSEAIPGSISVPGSGGSGAEQFGAGADASGGSSLAFGPGAVAAGTRGIAIGATNPAAAGNDSIAIGTNAITGTGVGVVCIGFGAAAVAAQSGGVMIGTNAKATVTAVAIGANTDAGANSGDAHAIAIGNIAQAIGFGAIAIGGITSVQHNRSIAIGYSATTPAANEVNIGSNVFLARWVFGGLQTMATLQDMAWNASGASGTDKDGKNWTIAPGRGTGTGIGGHFIIQTAPAGASGLSLNALVDRLIVHDTALVEVATGVDLQVTDGTLITGGGRVKNTTRVTTTHTILVSEQMVYADTDGGDFTVTLPASPVDGQEVTLKNSGTGTLTMATNGDAFEGSEDAVAMIAGTSFDMIFETTELWRIK